MQVTSLFAMFFAFLSFLAPLATLAMQITIPTNATSGSNSDISWAIEPADDLTGFISFVLAQGSTRTSLAANVNPTPGFVRVNIPTSASGDGWRVLALSSDGAQVGVSPSFSIFSIPKNAGQSMAAPVIGGVIAGVLALGLLVFGLFFYMRRRRQRIAGPEFNLEASFPQRHQPSGSFSTMSTAHGDAAKAPQMIEMEKVEWETELEEQFARARAATPISRGPTPALRNASPSPMPLVPQRGPTRNLSTDSGAARTYF
ncbi:hypothetical protein R3P38DRAFT_2860122 [Favolaschia claudopus]|uniref:Uncharacterized protein n=1 Tax=Favolaschia claudopus TaxID=2862362 RepID=A0AAW0DN41_9AGAR